MFDGLLVGGAIIALAVLAALAVGEAAWRRRLAIGLGASSSLLPLVFREGPALVRSVCALLGLMAVWKLPWLLHDGRSCSARFRIWQMLSPFDARLATRVPPALDARRLAAVVVGGLLAAVGVVGALHAKALHAPARSVLWTLAAALAVYCGAAAAADLVLVVHRLFGVDVPPIHLRPIASRTVGEFWGRRWNRPVHAWLRTSVFLPLARRRRARLGAILAFVASAAVHAWIVLPAAGGWGALTMAGFFLVHGVLVVAEDVLHTARWPRLAGHAWTVAAFALSAPLFLGPFAVALGLTSST